MATVELRGLVRVFADGTRVGPIDLRIEDGELVTLLGPSGSGKTTTLRMIAGFIEVDQGSILFDSEEVVRVPTRERNIGMVFQSVALFPNMTVYQNIAFGPDMAEWTHERTVARVEELADLLDIRPLLMRRINEISGGEAQRVALARALAKQPELLLLDEPLSALDPQLRERLQTEIRRIQKKLGITTIYVTHSQDEAFAISDRVAIIQDGRVVQVGTPEEIYDCPANEFVARFLGSGNVLEGVVKEGQQGKTVINISGVEIPNRANMKLGDRLKLSIKPEDITISTENTSNSARGEVISIIPQVGSFKITIDFEGIQIIALTYDESLVTKLRENDERAVYFSFISDSVVILNN
ncbi:MAG: ABC transporter ATP-binding protein [Candidatus Thorarchaeota archaeon]|nr:ABC transporter ATP-binding protein [Candidatus Thorarchaeota archaeon]